MTIPPPLNGPLSTFDKGRHWKWHLRALLRRLRLRIDRQFRKLLDPIPAGNLAQLKAMIVAYGHVRVPLIAWRGVVIDGHHRLIAVAQLLSEGVDLPDPKVETREFFSRSDAKLHVLGLQDAQRPGWGKEAKNAALIRLLTEEKDLVARIREENAARQREGKKHPKGGKGGTHQQIAEIVGVSRMQVVKADQITSDPKGREILAQCQAEQSNKYTPPIARAFNLFNKWRKNEAAQRAAETVLPPPPEGSLLDSVFCADVLDGLRRVRDAGLRVNLTLTSPPYPIKAVQYPNYKFDGEYERWLGWMRDVFALVYDVSGDGDRLAVNFDIPSIRPEDSRDYDRELRYKVDVDLYRLLTEDLKWVYRDEVCWYKQNAVSNRPMVGSFASASSPRFQRNWEPIVIFHKGSRIRERGDSDITVEEFNAWTMGHWAIKPETDLKAFHRCPFPLEIPRRLVKLLTYVGDTVLDPFAGIGTTPVAAKLLKRRYIGIDNWADYISFARARLETTTRFPDERSVDGPASGEDQIG